MKRYTQTLNLHNNPQLISAYIEEHRHVWTEIKDGIREVGITNMEIYIHHNTLFMIVETVDDFDWEKGFEQLATLPRQAEWEAYMSKYQVSQPGQEKKKKWTLMDKIFGLND
jgi:L-rhamnose mutarotase